MQAVLCACLFGASVAPVPVLPRTKPKFEAVLRIAAEKNPLGGGFAEVEVRSNVDRDLELLSTLPGQARVFLDVDVRDGQNARLSKEFYARSIASPLSSQPFPVGTIPAGKSLKIGIGVFHSADKAGLVPGKYKCRVRFKYDNVDALSDWVTVELTEKHLADK